MVLSASDGVEGLEALGRERVDLALIDFMMPNVNGFEFISSARAMTDVPIIVVSARGNPADKALGLDLGADGYITKPFDPSEVLAYVRAVLRRYRNGLSASLRSEDEPSTSPGILSCGDLELDREALVLRKRGRVVPLTVSEIKIVMRLMPAPEESSPRLNSSRPRLASRPRRAPRASWCTSRTSEPRSRMTQQNPPTLSR